MEFTYDKIPSFTVKSKKQRDNTKTSITQRLQTDLGRSVGITTATTLIGLNRYGRPIFSPTATAVLSKQYNLSSSRNLSPAVKLFCINSLPVLRGEWSNK